MIWFISKFTNRAKSGLTPTLAEVQKNQNRMINETNSKLASIAGVGKETYRMGAKIINSSNEDVKQRVLSGETSISAGYKELQNQDKLKSTSVKRCRT